MKKNILKLIPLINLILLSSCNNITYKDDNPLFIMGESIKADDSVKQEFLEKTKNYHNYLPDGFYKVNYSLYTIYKGEYVHLCDIDSTIEYQSCEKIEYDTNKVIDYRIKKFTFHKKSYSSAEYRQFTTPDKKGVYVIEENDIYDGSTFVRELTCSDNLKYNVYYQNIDNRFIYSLILDSEYVIDEYDNFDLYCFNDIYHFYQIYSSNNQSVNYDFKSASYIEDVSFKFSNDFKKLEELSYVVKISLFPYFQKNRDYYTRLINCSYTSLDNLDIKIPDLSNYYLMDFNDEYVNYFLLY